MIEFAFFFSILLIIYHHVGYPLLLKLCTKRRIESCVQQGPKHDFIFLLPFYNESQYIVEKVKNIASLDYPMNHVHVILANDGSNDDSLAKLQAHFADNDYAFSHEIINYTNNRGKLAVLNDLQEQVSKKAIAFFSDISAHLSKNTLQRANQYFQDNSIGAYSTSYQVKENTSEGEAKYLTYQNRIKKQESYLGSPMGYPGAGYAIRASLWKKVPLSTINEDFVIPLLAIASGKRGVFDDKTIAVEQEATSELMNWSRRLRISEGNIQQIGLLSSLFKSRLYGVIWMFLSGKVLRVCMPWCFLAVYTLSVLLIPQAPMTMSALFILQTIFYGLLTTDISKHYKYLRIFRYLFLGHLASLGGWFNFLSADIDEPWIRAKDARWSTPIPLFVRFGKGIMDKLLACVGMVFVMITFPIIALLIKLTSPGPIFYKQVRVGKSDGRLTRFFYLYKYRTMSVDAEKDGAKWASKNDPRITRVGDFLRKTRLDEIPQFWNVLKGDMSMVGPRPERPEFYQKLEEAIPYYSERLSGILPGITGFAQVNLKYDETIEDVRAKVGYDHAYAACLTNTRVWFKTDWYIIFKTFSVIINKLGQ